MAASKINKVRHDVMGRRRARIVNFTFSTSYPTGGEPLSAHQVDLSQVYAVFVCPLVAGYVIQPSADRSKLIAYQQSAATSALTEVTSTTDLSAVTVDLLFFGD